MMLFAKVLLFVITVNIFGCTLCFAGIFSWLFRTKDSDSKGNNEPFKESNYGDVNQNSDDSIMDVNIPFEMKSSDEKFLKEVSNHVSLQLSNLDVCHHRVILNLQKSCSDLTEEELAKVAVNLLNCQSYVEGRTVYTCTQQMALRECTKNMDETTWNAYHIVSNRVRAVCYSLRQQQFTIKTELTVNKLVRSTEHQINTMKLLEESQVVLKEVTSDTLNSINSGHQALQKQQKELSSAHLNMRNFVSSNIRELTREKRLIASGQKELSDIIIGIRKKLEDAQHQLKTQGIGQRDSHQKILNDLSDIQESAGRVWSQMEESTKKILARHEETAVHYSRLMHDVEKMNGTVHHLMDLSLKMKERLEEKFAWVYTLIGDTDATIQKLYCIIQHLCYCLFGMVVSIFLQVPYGTRLALIVLVPLNALSEVERGNGLPFSTLSTILAVCLFSNLSVNAARRRFSRYKNMKAISRDSSVPDSQETSISVPAKGKDEQFEHSERAEIDTTDSDPYFGGFWRRNKERSSHISPKERSTHSSPNSTHISTSNLANISEEIHEDKIEIPTSNGYSLGSFIESPLQEDSVRRRLLSRLDPVHPSVIPDKDSFLSPEGLKSSFVSRRSRGNTPLRERFSLSDSLSPKKLCLGICKSGLPCKKSVSANETFCYRHVGGVSREGTPF